MLTMSFQDIQEDAEGLEELLEEYTNLFQEATKLPPQRRCHHAIILKEDAPFPNICPYRYPY